MLSLHTVPSMAHWNSEVNQLLHQAEYIKLEILSQQVIKKLNLFCIKMFSYQKEWLSKREEINCVDTY